MNLLGKFQVMDNIATLGVPNIYHFQELLKDGLVIRYFLPHYHKLIISSHTKTKGTIKYECTSHSPNTNVVVFSVYLTPKLV
jgi:hypothetical protein